MSSPSVSFDGIGYTVTLFRPDATGTIKEEKHTFGDHKLSVCACRENELNSWERVQIKGAADAEGNLYYIHAKPYDVGAACFIRLQDKEEALALRKVINDAEQHYHEKDEYPPDSVCTFCGSMESECGGDHGDEMRDIMRQHSHQYR